MPDKPKSYEEIRASVVQTFIKLNARRIPTDDAVEEIMELIEAIEPLARDELYKEKQT